MKPSGCLKFVLWFVGIILLILFIIIGVATFVISDIALNMINEKAPQELHTEFHLAKLKLRLLRGYVGIAGLHIGQPEGYGTNALIDLHKLDVKVSLKSLTTDKIVIKSVHLQSAKINLIKTSNGVMNVEALIPADETTNKTTSGGTKSAKSEVQEPMEAPSIDKKVVKVLIKTIKLDKCQITYTDHTLSDPPLSLTLAEIDITLHNLLVDPNAIAESIKPAILNISAHMLQPGKEDALIGGDAHIGPVGGDIPNINAALVISGVELSTFGNLVPPGVPQALGGNAFDLGIKLALATNVLNCNLKLEMIAGNTHNLHISGTPTNPIVEKSGILFGVVTRFGGGLGHAVGNLGGASVDLAGTAVGTVGNVGKGAFNAVGTLGKGLLQTTKGVVTADLGDITEGMTQSTVGTVSETAHAVTDTRKGVVDGVSQAGSTSLGGKTAEKWRKNTPKRHKMQWSKVQEIVNSMPYPPKEEVRIQ